MKKITLLIAMAAVLSTPAVFADGHGTGGSVDGTTGGTGDGATGGAGDGATGGAGDGATGGAGDGATGGTGDGTAPNDIQIFTKDFGLSVKKESEVIVELPDEELVELDIDELSDTESGYKPYIGHMHFETTATNCEATITTNNGFALKGHSNDATLATYNIEYTSGLSFTDGNEQPGSDLGTGAPSIPTMASAIFGAGFDATQPVACEMADLFMDVLTMQGDAPTDFYGDVIHVEVRAES